MKLWFASTDADAVASAFRLGLFEGVLTNPTTLAAASRPPLDVIRDLCSATTAPVFYQLAHDSADAMRAAAAGLLDHGWTNLGIKVPLTRAGCEVLHWLREQKVALRLATAVTSVSPLLLATALDVPWVTPSGSALEKLGGPSKLTLLTEMQAALDRQQSSTRLIPSLSSPGEMNALAAVGIRAGFIWDRDLARFVDHDLVSQTAASFEPAWSKLNATPAVANLAY